MCALPRLANDPVFKARIEAYQRAYLNDAESQTAKSARIYKEFAQAQRRRIVRANRSDKIQRAASAFTFVSAAFIVAALAYLILEGSP